MKGTQRGILKTLVLAALTVLGLNTAFVCGQNEPYIGYMYPAGGRQGTEVFVTVAGQFLRQPRQVYISGTGVRASVIQYYPPIVNLKKEQRDWIIDRLKQAADIQTRRGSAAGSESKIGPAGTAGDPNVFMIRDKPEMLSEGIKVPDHPLLYGLESRNMRQLAHIQTILLRPRDKIQPNRQIGEMVLIKLLIDADARPGPRDLRLVTAAGMANPISIRIGTFSEYLEVEPNDKEAYPARVLKFPELPKEKPLQLPIVINGQILPGDMDRFRFHAQSGDKLVIETQARTLIPYLADAVPGWFQAVVALYDDGGNEIAFADDYRFSPDPVLYYEIAKTGDYELMIHDSIYRGREDFVYRVSIGQYPFITELFPLGGKLGQTTIAQVKGWNLPKDTLALDTSGDNPGIRMVTAQGDGAISNAVQYAVAALPQIAESGTHDTLKTAQDVSVPCIVNGQISTAGQVDVYRFRGRKDDEMTFKILARRLCSPLDSLLRLTDASGKVIDWNDDHSVKDKQFLFKETDGLLTHHADSMLSVKLSYDGFYYVHVADSQGHGGSAYAYRLHIEPKTPDFELRVTPSGLSAPAGAVVPITVYVLPENGFDTEIQVRVKNTDAGFDIQGGVIPRGKDSIRMTLRVPGGLSGKVVALQLEGQAKIGDRVITRPVIGAEDKMQAFLYRHLVPTHEVVFAVLENRRPIPPMELSNTGIVEIPQGGSAQLVVKTAARQLLKDLTLQFKDSPEGFSLRDVAPVPQGLRFSINVDSKVEAGFADNLILQAVRTTPAVDKERKPAAAAQPQFAAVLPAIPVRITKAPSPSVQAQANPR